MEDGRVSIAKHLTELKESLDKFGLCDSSLNLDNIIVQAMLQQDDWQKVIDAVDNGYVSGTTKAASALINAAYKIEDAKKKLDNVDQQTLRQAMDTINNISKDMSLDNDAFSKLSTMKNFNNKLIKQAQLSWLSKYFKRGVKGIFEVLPVIGVVFSVLFAMKSIGFGVYEFSKMIESETNLGLSWKDALNPGIYATLANKNQDNPQELVRIVHGAQISRAFWDEGISAVTNGLDAVKDIIFFFLDIASLGSVIFIDIGLSASLFLMESQYEESMNAYFDNVLSKIRANAGLKLSSKSSEYDTSKMWWNETEDIGTALAPIGEYDTSEMWWNKSD